MSSSCSWEQPVWACSSAAPFPACWPTLRTSCSTKVSRRAQERRGTPSGRALLPPRKPLFLGSSSYKVPAPPPHRSEGSPPDSGGNRLVLAHVPPPPPIQRYTGSCDFRPQRNSKHLFPGSGVYRPTAGILCNTHVLEITSSKKSRVAQEKL